MTYYVLLIFFDICQLDDASVLHMVHVHNMQHGGTTVDENK